MDNSTQKSYYLRNFRKKKFTALKHEFSVALKNKKLSDSNFLNRLIDFAYKHKDKIKDFDFDM